MSRIRNSSALAYSMWARTAAPRPVQRIPAYAPTEADIQRESRQIFYGQLIHQGYDEQAAHEMTIAHFAIADHVLVGTLRDEE